VLYRGRGRISPLEGKLIKSEYELWVQTCRNALGRVAALSGGRVEAPWRRMLQAGRILGADDGLWRKIVLTTFGGHDDTDWEQAMSEAVGFSELDRQEVQQIIQTRSDSDKVL
jgi:RAD50-interacting protein 1